MKIKLFIITLCLISLCFTSCKAPESNGSQIGETEDTLMESSDAKVMQNEDALLPLCEDKGMGYIDSFIFFGESTTYHLKSRGVLSGGKDTTQVWANKSGTMKLDLSIDKQKIIYPETNELLTLTEAAAKRKPKYILLTFGLNGAVQNVKTGEEYFKTCYKKLIDAIRSSSPNTKIIIQSAFPVAENMDMSAYSINQKTLNEYIDLQNAWAYSIACEEDCKYLDTSSILKDKNNNLKIEYQVGDGHHLTTEAYQEILYYIRTHG
jgi:lysophospholipase L1-like esterase